MNESLLTAWAIIGLLTGAGLLTYLTQGSGQLADNEFSRKKKKKKRRMETQDVLAAQDDHSEVSAINAPSSIEQTDQLPHKY